MAFEKGKTYGVKNTNVRIEVKGDKTSVTTNNGSTKSISTTGIKSWLKDNA